MPIQLQKLDYIIIFVGDMQRSTAFYRDLLGLPLKFSSPGWTEFVTGSTTIALHPARDTTQSSSQERSPAGQAQLGFQVDDLKTVYPSLQSEGVRFSLPPTQQPEGGTVAVMHDPDGSYCPCKSLHSPRRACLGTLHIQCQHGNGRFYHARIRTKKPGQLLDIPFLYWPPLSEARIWKRSDPPLTSVHQKSSFSVSSASTYCSSRK